MTDVPTATEPGSGVPSTDPEEPVLARGELVEAPSAGGSDGEVRYRGTARGGRGTRQGHAHSAR
jgi:hypothetical protein